MYLFNTSYGEVFRPRPKAPAPTPPPKPPEKPPPKAGKVVVPEGHWRFCQAPSGRSISCDLILKIRFRRSFDEFLREVEVAYGRWMESSTARMLVKKLDKDLKQWHGEMLNFHSLDDDPMCLTVGLYYRKSNGSWLVKDSDLRVWRRLIDL